MHDLIVVGSGTAGSYLVSRLKDIDILMLEKNKKTKTDSGIVSKKITGFLPKRFLGNKIREMKFISPSGLCFSLKSEEPFAYFLKRDFQSQLRKEAKKKSKIRYETVRNVEYLEDRVVVCTDNNDYQCSMVIGADGANSVVRRSAEIKSPNTALGMIVRAKLDSEIKIYLNKYFSPDFFSWIVPDEYGLLTSIRPNEYFEYFRKKMNLPGGRLCVSPIPFGYTKSYFNRTLLIGDSCGMTKPLTGGGIIFSLTACNYAKQTIKEAFDTGRFDRSFLKDYEKKWKGDFGREIKRQMLCRKIYRNLTNKEIDNLFKKFGPHIEKLEDFDYDHFSKSWREMPKWELLKFLIKKLPLIF
jgi:digeranylgeranylglycerophospholipid reductase